MNLNQPTQQFVRIWASVFLGLFLSFTSLLSFAQASYPNRPVRIIVPFSAGGASDVLARFIEPELNQRLAKDLCHPRSWNRQ